MLTDELIRSILLTAEEVRAKEGWRFGDMVVLPLTRHGQVWWDGNGYRFSEERAEISTYNKNGKSSSVFGRGQFEVKLPTPEQVQEAVDAWNSGEIYGRKVADDDGTAG